MGASANTSTDQRGSYRTQQTCDATSKVDVNKMELCLHRHVHAGRVWRGHVTQTRVRSALWPIGAPPQWQGFSFRQLLEVIFRGKSSSKSDRKEKEKSLYEKRETATLIHSKTKKTPMEGVGVRGPVSHCWVIYSLKASSQH